MGEREENWGARREGIRDSPKTGVLSGTHLCRDYVSSFHGIIHWTWWIVIFFHFSFFLIFWPPYWFFAFFLFFFPIFHLSSISSISHTTKGHATTRNTEEWDRQAHQHVFSVREKKKIARRKSRKPFIATPFRKRAPASRWSTWTTLNLGGKSVNPLHSMLDKPPSDRADTTVYDNLITDLRTSRRAHDLRSCITNHERITTSV